MKVICQRVTYASCKVDNNVTGEIRSGLMLLVSFCINDSTMSDDTILKMAKKIANLRIFSDQDGKMNLSIKDIGGTILSISQFTLYGNPYEGNRPSFTNALNPTEANLLYKKFNQVLRDNFDLVVEEGTFGADMQIDMHLDGPVTIELEY